MYSVQQTYKLTFPFCVSVVALGIINIFYHLDISHFDYILSNSIFNLFIYVFFFFVMPSSNININETIFHPKFFDHVVIPEESLDMLVSRELLHN